MATLKHLSSKNADYGVAEQYLTFEHDEFTGKPILDENGRLVPRQDYRISSLNCGEEDFAVACMRANLRYGKNQQREDVKSHHYILSFDPRDGPDHGLTMDKAQALGERFCAEQFPGHQALVCTHPDGHNHSGNIHVHIVINSLRVAEVERKPYMDRASDTQAGAKHRCTAAAMRHFRAEVMELCQGAGLYQIALLYKALAAANLCNNSCSFSANKSMFPSDFCSVIGMSLIFKLAINPELIVPNDVLPLPFCIIFCLTASLFKNQFKYSGAAFDSYARTIAKCDGMT